MEIIGINDTLLFLDVPCFCLHLFFAKFDGLFLQDVCYSGEPYLGGGGVAHHRAF